MITTLDKETILYKALKASELPGLISGGIYTDGERPADSKLEDIIINTLPITYGDTLALGTANVNIYVPDKVYKIKGQEHYRRDTERIQTLITKAVPAVEEAYGQLPKDQYNFWLGNQQVYPEPEINQHYINLRVEFQFFQTA